MENGVVPNIKNKVSQVLGNNDILFIIPPFVTTRTPILGPHILHALALQQDWTCDILYLNLLLASLAGLDLYESVSYAQPFQMLGERLFARSAHDLPPLGQKPKLCQDPAVSVFGEPLSYQIEEFEYKYTDLRPFDLNTLLKLEKTCWEFIQEVSKIIADLDYKIIGCSSNWEQNNCCMALFKHIKQFKLVQPVPQGKNQHPRPVTMMGGANCEGEMGDGLAMLCRDIDFIFSGESEKTFGDFLDEFRHGHLPAKRVIRGKRLENLDELPQPVYEPYLTQRKIFLGEHDRDSWALGYETSRGCWWGKCHFCGMNGIDRAPFRWKSPGKALGDLDKLFTGYPGRSVIMTDKVMPVPYREKVLPMLGEKENGSVIAYEHRSDLSFADLYHLKKARVEVIKPGIEALSTGLLKIMNKGISAWQNIFFLRNTAALGMYVDWNLLWGFPGDEAQYYQETLELLPLLRHCSPPHVFRHICIDRFSPYFSQPGDFHIQQLRPWAVYHMIYPDGADVGKLANRFIGDYPCGSHDTPGLIRDIAGEVQEWKQRGKEAKLVMIPFMEQYMIYDNRGIKGNKNHHVVTVERAKKIMSLHDYDESGDLKWAVSNQLGVVLDGRYVPLVTADPVWLRDIMMDIG